METTVGKTKEYSKHLIAFGYCIWRTKISLEFSDSVEGLRKTVLLIERICCIEKLQINND